MIRDVLKNPIAEVLKLPTASGPVDTPETDAPVQLTTEDSAVMLTEGGTEITTEAA